MIFWGKGGLGFFIKSLLTSIAKGKNHPLLQRRGEGDLIFLMPFSKEIDQQGDC